MKNYHNNISWKCARIIIIFSISFLLGCNKFVEVDPPATSVNGGNIYSENGNAISVLTGLYAKMATSTFSVDLSSLPDLAADNLTLIDQSNPVLKQVFQNAVSVNTMINFWEEIYSYLYITNAAIEGLTRILWFKSCY